MYFFFINLLIFLKKNTILPIIKENTTKIENHLDAPLIRPKIRFDKSDQEKFTERERKKT